MCYGYMIVAYTMLFSAKCQNSKRQLNEFSIVFNFRFYVYVAIFRFSAFDQTNKMNGRSTLETNWVELVQKES